MPTTSSGETVYASPDDLRSYVQTDPDALGKTVNDPADETDPDDWGTLLDRLQASAKARIDEFCQRDFEDHTDDTIVVDGEDGTSTIQLTGPIREVHEVRVHGSDGSGNPIDAASYHAKPSGMLVRTGGGSRGPAVASGTGVARTHSGYRSGGSRDRYTHHEPEWPPGYGNLAVSLDWGYETPPADVREAEMKIVDNTLSGMAQKREGTVVAADDFAAEIKIPSAMSAEIRGMLKPHLEMGVFS